MRTLTVHYWLRRWQLAGLRTAHGPPERGTGRRLVTCRSERDDRARLACFDRTSAVIDVKGRQTGETDHRSELREVVRSSAASFGLAVGNARQWPTFVVPRSGNTSAGRPCRVADAHSGTLRLRTHRQLGLGDDSSPLRRRAQGGGHDRCGALGRVTAPRSGEAGRSWSNAYASLAVRLRAPHSAGIGPATSSGSSRASRQLIPQ